MKRVAWAALCATLCGLAWEPHAYAAEPKRALMLLAACGLAIAALVRVLYPTRRGRSRAVPWALRAALAFLALSAASLAWGSGGGALDLATWIGAAIFGSFAFDGRRLSAVALARLVALWLGGAVSVVALGSALAGARGFALHAGQGNPNWLGLLLATTLPLSLDTCILHLYRRRARSRRAVIAAALALAQVPALALSHSRVAWVAAGVACLLVALGLLRERARRLAAVSAIALALVSALTLAGGAARGEEREGGDVPAARSLHGRAWIWRSSAVAARDALPVGSGLGTFARSYHDAQGRALSRLAPSVAARTYENATTAHQEYLQIATESGPLAAAAFALALALGALAHARSRFWGGAGALVACAVTSLGDSPFRQPAVVLLAALVLGACRARDSDTKTKRAQRSGTLARLSALALVLLAAWALEVSVRAWLSTRAYVASFDAPPDARLRLLLRSARVSESNGEPRLELGLLHLAAGEPHAALADLAAADARLADPGIRAARGQAFLVLGDAIAAERSYRAALSWNPGSVRARVGLAESLVRQERLDEAEAEARIARKLSPGSAQVRELSDAIHEGMSDE